MCGCWGDSTPPAACPTFSFRSKKSDLDARAQGPRSFARNTQFFLGPCQLDGGLADQHSQPWWPEAKGASPEYLPDFRAIKGKAGSIPWQS